ncbi:MAG: DUF1080 domain-containing protein [Gemmatimonadales bacterium]|nr:DUF1080 domain-containing protein [Gemmatimonadota bacterium]MBP6444088.1 DUF1080 domain-containing protein [Gemmatimonadales bacterium]MBP6572051.1 DUF1080 domain-containing protein [Gemmatimonadales bacterium]MBP7620672.1 DUF1080 domain-containing protein [Gemmatimonadales bacterium]
MLNPLARLAVLTTTLILPLAGQAPVEWSQHSMTRPKPPIVHPGPAGAPVPAPADAIVLFDGSSLAAWQTGKDSSGGAAPWRIVGQALEVVPGKGTIRTRQPFGDVQLHLEWRTPKEVKGTGQERGNSGVFFMGRYELQILDSWENTTYADGQAASIYGQFPPLVNASRAPGEWQSYDIVFRRPIFDAAGLLAVPARMTVFHNGILVHQEAILLGPTSNGVRTPYSAHPDRLPIALQDHGVTVQFRNIWLRELTTPGP